MGFREIGILPLVIIWNFIICFTNATPVVPSDKPQYLDALHGGKFNGTKTKLPAPINIVENVKKLASLIPVFGVIFVVVLVVLLIRQIYNRYRHRPTDETYSIVSSDPPRQPTLPPYPGLPKGRRKGPAVVIPGKDKPRQYLHSNLRISYSVPSSKASLAEFLNGPGYEPQRAYLLSKSYQEQIPPKLETKTNSLLSHWNNLISYRTNC